MRFILMLLTVMISLSMLASPALAELVQVSGVTYDAAREMLVIHANGPLVPQVTRLDHPHRMVVDLPGSALAPSYQQLEGIPGSGISRIRVGQYQATITRVVLDLSKEGDFDVVAAGNEVLIPLKTRSAGRPPVTGALNTAPDSIIRAVNYHNGNFTVVMSRRLPYWSHVRPGNPVRYTLVFPNAGVGANLLGKEREVSGHGISRWRVMQLGTEARIEIEMSKPPTFDIQPSAVAWHFNSDKAHATVRPSPLPTTVATVTPRPIAHVRPTKARATGGLEGRLPQAVRHDPATQGWPGAPDAPLAMRKVDGQWQMLLTADSRFKYKTIAMGDDRVHVDISGGRVALPRDSVYIDNGLIARVRVTPRTGGATRLTIDLDQPVRHAARMLGNQRSLLITMSRLSKERVTVDPGHGGTDHGAVGTRGTREKDVTLGIATRLARVMESNGMSVQMTRMKDLEILLRPRVEMANRNEADVFVSIHANSFGNQHGVEGIETYYFTDESYGLAKSIHKQLLKSLNQPDRGVRKNNFYVVHHTKMPAALIEIGYLSNPHEEALLATPAYQEKAAQAIFAGIKDFLAERKAKP